MKKLVAVIVSLFLITLTLSSCDSFNKKKKFVRPSQENPKGGVINLEYPVNISKVMIFCDKCKKGVRVGMEIKDSGKNRVCKKCGKSLDK